MNQTTNYFLCHFPKTLTRRQKRGFVMRSRKQTADSGHSHPNSGLGDISLLDPRTLVLQKSTTSNKYSTFSKHEVRRCIHKMQVFRVLTSFVEPNCTTPRISIGITAIVCKGMKMIHEYMAHYRIMTNNSHLQKFE